MTEKEKQIQSALGTIERQMFVSADWKDTEGLINDFKKALENFGLFMYRDPDADDIHSFIISNEKLTDKQIEKLFEYDEDEE